MSLLATALLAVTPLLQQETEPIKIMPLGDSITEGTAPGGYRTKLYRSLTQLGYAVDFVGTFQSNPEPGRLADADHDGWGGRTIRGIVEGWVWPGQPPQPLRQRLQSLQPDIVLLHAGTNDLGYLINDDPWWEVGERLAALIDGIQTELPDAWVVVGQIVPTAFPSTNLKTESYNREIVELVRERALAGRRVALADHYAAVPESEIADGVHPSDRGYDLMASEWLRGLAQTQTGIVLPDPIPAALSGVSITASHTDPAADPSWLVDGSGVVAGSFGAVYHDAEQAQGTTAWKTPFLPSQGAIGEYQQPTSPVWLRMDLGQARNVKRLHLFNGETSAFPFYLSQAPARRVAIYSSIDGSSWTPRKLATLRDPGAGPLNPGEVIELDLPGVRYLAIRVLDSQVQVTAQNQAWPFWVALSEVRVHAE